MPTPSRTLPLSPALLRHPLLSLLIQRGRRDTPVIVALRNTAAIVLPLAVGALLQREGLGLGIAVGALSTMFADQPGPYRLRLRRMLIAASVGGLSALAGSLLGGWPGPLVAVAAAWAFGGALLVALDADAARVGLTSVVLLIIMGAEPRPLPEAALAGFLVFAGGLLQALFALAAWPLGRHRPERAALGAAFDALAAFARADAARPDLVALPPSLNDLQVLLFGTGRARGPAAAAFRVLAELAERVRIELFGLAHQQATSASPRARALLARSRSRAADVLEAVATALKQAAPPRCDAALEAYARTAREALTPPVTSEGEGVVPALAALGGQLRAIVRNADRAGSLGEIRAQRAELRLPPSLRPHNPLAILRANLRRGSPAFRHAVRCAVAVGLALALSRLFALPHGYWMPMTVIIVLKPDFGATWRYGMLRVIGTLGGLVFTTALWHVGLLERLWEPLFLLALFCFAFRELAQVQYGAAVASLTGVVVILLAFAGVPVEASMMARLLNTALGSALALLVYILWPTWERGRERDALADMVEAYRKYLLTLFHGTTRARHAARIDARAARSAAQASLDRLRGEPASSIALPQAERIVAQANRVVRATMLLEAARDTEAREISRETALFFDSCAAALGEIAALLRASRPPRLERPLRAEQRALVASLGEKRDAFAQAVANTSDRLVDAINGLRHALV